MYLALRFASQFGCSLVRSRSLRISFQSVRSASLRQVGKFCLPPSPLGVEQKKRVRVPSLLAVPLFVFNPSGKVLRVRVPSLLAVPQNLSSPAEKLLRVRVPSLYAVPQKFFRFAQPPHLTSCPLLSYLKKGNFFRLQNSNE